MIQGNFKVAPLDIMAKVVTVLMIVAAGAIPFILDQMMYFAVFLPVTIFATWLFSVTGYALEDKTLLVKRPLWVTTIVLPGGATAREEPNIREGLLKTFGNGGLFGYTGGFRNRKLGNFKTYATSWSHAVSITSEADSFCIVVTPENPAEFIQCINV
ncbi:MAG: hypothetical protein KAR40_14970 [Candidatus Sabulitectum sp.]|nr:hypothetical protein [Candidatus Sabulitectum sp.]